MTKELSYFKPVDRAPEQDPVSAAEARTIIGLFKVGKDETTIFLEDKYPTHKIEQAKAEWLKLKNEAMVKILGQEVITPGVAAELDGEGKEITPAVKEILYDPKDKTEFQTSLSDSYLFTGKEIVDDILAFDDKSTPLSMTFAQLKAKYYPKAVVSK